MATQSHKKSLQGLSFTLKVKNRGLKKELETEQEFYKKIKKAHCGERVREGG